MSKAFIVVFIPHRMPSWAEAFYSEADFIDDWKSGVYDRRCFTNNNLTEEEQNVTFLNAFNDVGHDLYSLLKLDSMNEVSAYIDGKYGQHNHCPGKVLECAKELQWIKDLD